MKRDPSEAKTSERIGYLLRMYPRFSQTFIVNEILELQRQGLCLSIASLRKPADGLFHEAVSRVRSKADYLPETVLSDLSKVWRAGWTSFTKRPVDYLRATACALGNAGIGWIDLAQAALAMRWVKKRKIDHVHVHFGTQEATVALLANVLGGLSYSLTLHAFDIFRDNVDRRLLGRKINASKFTITVSEFNRRFILENIPGVDPDKVRVNYNGIDLERFNQTSSGREPALVFAVGRLIEKKGFIHLVRAIEHLRDQGCSVQCKIAGDGPEQKRLEQAIARADLESLVELTGPLEQGQVRDLMQRATCFVLPCVEAKDGNVDALPTVLLESLASGCPSISTRLSGIPEIIEHDVSGLLVAPEAELPLAAEIRRIIESPDLAARLAVGGRRRAEDRFDVRHNAAIMNDWLRAAAGRKRAPSRPAKTAQVEVPAAPSMAPCIVEGSG